MSTTNHAATAFVQDGKKHIRVYYQAQDGTIRESSFEENIGWFTRGDGIVAKDAIVNSPITVTRWNDDKVTMIHVYFLSSSNSICQAQGQHTSGVTTWSPVVVLSDKSEPKVARGSQLAVARPGKDNATLRVFYQEKADSDGKFPVREIKYTKGRKETKWAVQPGSVLGVSEHSCLSAVSAKSSGDVRLYYQGEDGKLGESFWSSRTAKWTSKVPNETYDLVPTAPISAVNWYIPGGDGDSNLRIRVYTVIKSKNAQITECSFEGEGWDDDTDLDQIATSSLQYSAVAATRDTGADKTQPISVLYQPFSGVIDIAPIGAEYGDEFQAAADKVVRPKGIPTSRQ